jgi:hypothetical protein
MMANPLQIPWFQYPGVYSGYLPANRDFTRRRPMTNIKLNIAVNQNPKSHIDQILKEFEKGCDEAILRREGKRLIIEPKKRAEVKNYRHMSRDLTFLPLGDIRI